MMAYSKMPEPSFSLSLSSIPPSAVGVACSGPVSGPSPTVFIAVTLHYRSGLGQFWN